VPNLSIVNTCYYDSRGNFNMDCMFDNYGINFNCLGDDGINGYAREISCS
jgi:hypothetical protein